MFHVIQLFLIMFVAPILVSLFEYRIVKRNKPEIKYNIIFIKWFVFFAIGVRSSSAGLMQIFNPSYTASLLNVTMSDDIIIRELGLCNLSFGILGLISIKYKQFIKPACVAISIFYFGASILHTCRISDIKMDELMSLTGDIYVTVTSLFIIVKNPFNRS